MSAASSSADSISRALSTLTSSLTSLAHRHHLSRPPLLVAVSKFHPPSSIRLAYSFGQRHFGENYVVELVEKAQCEELKGCEEIKWSFIGHLQSNKCKALVKGVGDKLWQVECVDSKKLATELNKACLSLSPPRSSPLRVLIQVNTSSESSKSGCHADEVVDLYRYVMRECKGLKASGLMTIGRLVEDGTPQRDCFELLRKCKEEVVKALGLKVRGETSGTNSSSSNSSDASSSSSSTSSGSVTSEEEVDFELSMGMSGDYEVACEYGATEVRIGSTIFGARPDPKYAKAAQAKAAAETSAAAADSSQTATSASFSSSTSS